MLVAQNITCNAGSKKILDDVSAAFNPGVVNLIIGTNGAGKSTLIKVLSGQLTADSGTVTYAGTPISNFTSKALARHRALLSQHLELGFPLKAEEVVMMGRYPHWDNKPTVMDRQICEEVMAFLNIESFKERNYLTLSGGERQRVQFARVLAQIWHPIPDTFRYLLLDEPLTFLDIHYQHHFMQQIRSLCSADLVIIGVIHDLNLAAKYADNLILLHDGQVLANGTPETILTVKNIKTAYGVAPEIIEADGHRFIFF